MRSVEAAYCRFRASNTTGTTGQAGETMVALGMSVLLAALGAAGQAPQVAVSIEPLAFFVEGVTGPGARVSVLVGPGQSPHTYEPAPRDLAAISSADVFFGLGMPFEQRVVAKIAGVSEVRVVDAAAGIQRRRIEGHGHNHGHGHGAEGLLDPHVWLDPGNAAVIAKNIAQVLQKEDPGNAERYKKNLQALLDDLEALDARLHKLLDPLRGRTVYVYHPAFGYFTDAYGLKQASVEVSGKEPTARELAEFVERARHETVRVIFVQRQFPDRAARSIAESVGATVVSVDPLARNYIANLESIAEKIHEALSAK